jgi:hypothetical protein
MMLDTHCSVRPTRLAMYAGVSPSRRNWMTKAICISVGVSSSGSGSSLSDVWCAAFAALGALAAITLATAPSRFSFPAPCRAQIVPVGRSSGIHDCDGPQGTLGGFGRLTQAFSGKGSRIAGLGDIGGRLAGVEQINMVRLLGQESWLASGLAARFPGEAQEDSVAAGKTASA